MRYSKIPKKFKLENKYNVYWEYQVAYNNSSKIGFVTTPTTLRT